jgi:hypothetical protein
MYNLLSLVTFFVVIFRINGFASPLCNKLCERTDEMPRFRCIGRKSGLEFVVKHAESSFELDDFVDAAFKFPKTVVVAVEQRARVHLDPPNVSTYFLIEFLDEFESVILWKSLFNAKCTTRVMSPEIELRDYVELRRRSLAVSKRASYLDQWRSS